MPVPVVNDVSPKTSPSTGGALITIRGSGFGDVTGVIFGGVAAQQFRVDSDSQITAVSPPHAGGPVVVQVGNSSGFSAAESGAEIHYTEVEGRVANAAPAADRAAAASSEGADVRFMVRFAMQATAVIPIQTAGAVEVVVTRAGGFSSGLLGLWKYLLGKPVVTSISPSTGPIAGNTPVWINGSGFLTATGVAFGQVPAKSYSIQSDQLICAVSPAVQSPCTVDVEVGNPAGPSATSVSDRFTYT